MLNVGDTVYISGFDPLVVFYVVSVDFDFDPLDHMVELKLYDGRSWCDKSHNHYYDMDHLVQVGYEVITRCPTQLELF